MRIYLDLCSLNRLLDDQRQTRVAREARAVEEILKGIDRGRFTWISSEVLIDEASRNRDDDRRETMLVLLRGAKESEPLSVSIVARARVLGSIGLAPYDALHIAAAESAAVVAFLTTDDTLVKRASRPQADIRLKVCNPVSWWEEVNR